MANPHKGEVSFQSLGETRTLAYSTNIMCELEDELDLGISDIIDQLKKSPRMSLVRSVFRAGLARGATDAHAGDVLDDIGLIRAVELLADAFTRAFPAPEKGARPRKGGEAGIGKDS